MCYKPKLPVGKMSDELSQLIKEHIADFTKFRWVQVKERSRKTNLDHLGRVIPEKLLHSKYVNNNDINFVYLEEMRIEGQIVNEDGNESDRDTDTT